MIEMLFIFCECTYIREKDVASIVDDIVNITQRDTSML